MRRRTVVGLVLWGKDRRGSAASIAAAPSRTATRL